MRGLLRQRRFRWALGIGFVVAAALAQLVVPTQETNWQDAETSPKSKRISIRFETDDPRCEHFHHAEVEETDKVVKVAIHTQQRLPWLGGFGCDGAAHDQTTDIELDRPLGDRKVVDVGSPERAKKWDPD